MENIRQAVLDADVRAFRFINTDLHNDVLALIMKFTANDIFLAVVVITCLALLVKKGGEKAKTNAAFALWALIVTEIISTKLLKPVFRRPRPVAELPDVNFLVEMRHYGWGFPSTHTAMAAALVTVLWNDYKSLRIPMSLFVLFVGFFCIYTGGHYPLDVAAGFILGILTGTIFNIMKKIKPK